MIEQLCFAGVVAVTFFAAVRVVATANLVRAVFWLALSLLGTAVLYAMLEAPFLAGVQVLTYVGGVVTLMIFGVMVTRQHDGTAVVAESADQPRAALLCGGLAALMGFSIRMSKIPDAPPAPVQSTADLANALLGRHLIAFEVASLLLLAAIVGAVVLARKKDVETRTQRPALPALDLPPQRGGLTP